MLDGSISLDKKQDDFFSVLHSLESDANCFKSTNYVSKLVKDFLDEPLEKNSDSEVVRLPPHDDFISEIFNTPVPLSAGVECIFSRYKDVLRPEVKQCTFSNPCVF